MGAKKYWNLFMPAFQPPMMMSVVTGSATGRPVCAELALRTMRKLKAAKMHTVIRGTR